MPSTLIKPELLSGWPLWCRPAAEVAAAGRAAGGVGMHALGPTQVILRDDGARGVAHLFVPGDFEAAAAALRAATCVAVITGFPCNAPHDPPHGVSRSSVPEGGRKALSCFACRWRHVCNVFFCSESS